MMDEQLLHTETLNPECVDPIEQPAKKAKFSKKTILILCAILAVIAVVVVILLIPSRFERVKNDAVQIAGQLSSRGKNEFTIDTYPYDSDTYRNMESGVIAMLAPGTQKNALEAIRYVNKELGFGSYLYDQMLETNALMGLQSDENENYKVTWKYHPDTGLEVTYLKK